MYNSKYICKYNSEDIFLETDKVTDSEKEFIRDTLYKEDLLNIFCISKYDEEQMNINMHILYEKIKNNEELSYCMKSVAGVFMSTDEELGLIILFSYDYLYLSHICISEFLEKGKISEYNILNLKKIINK
jgi:hypothetical protein